MDAQHGRSRHGPLDGRVKLLAPAPVDTHDGSKSVINLSKSFVLTAAQFSVLDRGLTFVPSKGTESRDALHQVHSDLQEYHRGVRLAVHFENHPPSVPPPFMPKSVIPYDRLGPRFLPGVVQDPRGVDPHMVKGKVKLINTVFSGAVCIPALISNVIIIFIF